MRLAWICNNSHVCVGACMCVHLLTSIYFIFALVPQILKKMCHCWYNKSHKLWESWLRKKKDNKRFIDMVSLSRNPISWFSSVTAVPTSCWNLFVLINNSCVQKFCDSFEMTVPAATMCRVFEVKCLHRKILQYFRRLELHLTCVADRLQDSHCWCWT